MLAYLLSALLYLSGYHPELLTASVSQNSLQAIEQSYIKKIEKDQLEQLELTRALLREYREQTGSYPKDLIALISIFDLPDSDIISSYSTNDNKDDYALCTVDTKTFDEKCLTKISFLYGELSNLSTLEEEYDFSNKNFEDLWGKIRSTRGDKSLLYSYNRDLAQWYHKDPTSVEFLTLYALYLGEEGHQYSNVFYVETEDVVNTLIDMAHKKQPSNIYVKLLRHTWAHNSGDYFLAHQLATDIFLDSPSSPIAQLQVNHLWETQKRIANLEKFANDPENSEYIRVTALSYLGMEYGNTNKYDKAIETFEKLVEKTQHPWDYQILGRTYMNKGDCEGAIKVYLQSIEVAEIGMIKHWDLPAAYFKCAKDHQADGDLNKAVEYMEQAVELNQDMIPNCECSADYRTYLADLLLLTAKTPPEKLENTRRAVQLYAEALTFKSKQPSRIKDKLIKAQKALNKLEELE